MPEGVRMATRSNFEIAALDSLEEPKPAERTAEIAVNGKYISLWRRPTPGQYAMFQLRMSRDTGIEQSKGVDRFFANLILTPEEIVAGGRTDTDGVPYTKRFAPDPETDEPADEQPVGHEWFLGLMERGVIEQDLLIDLLKEAIEIHSGFPTTPESDSSSSQKPSGPPSTGRSRRVASTPSA